MTSILESSDASSSNDTDLASRWFRMRKTIEVQQNPVCRLLKGAVNKLPILEEFSTRGCFQYQLNNSFIQLNKDVFDMSREFLDLEEDHPLKQSHLIQHGSLNGYHGYGGLSKYNENRCGFILENEDVLDFLGQGENGMFVSKIREWRDAYHTLAEEILAQLANQLDIPQVGGESMEGAAHVCHDYFDRELNFKGNGQLHIKRSRNSEVGDRIRLLAHTDPSLITMVVHDREGRMMEGAMGLEIYHKGRRQFEPLEAGGWSVVTVFVGDVLARVCGQQLVHAPMHRVTSTHENPRQAATFFIQPSLSALLNPIPVRGHNAKKTNVTYGSWKEQKYSKYFKKS